MDKTRYFHCSAAVLTASCSPALALTSPTLPQCPRVPTQTPHRLHPPTRHTDTTFQLPATIHETRDRRHGVWSRWPIESCQRTFSKFHSALRRAFSLLKAPTNSHSPGTVKLREGSLTALFTSHGHLYLLRPREGARPGGVGSPGEGVGVGGDIAGHARVLVPVPGAAHP